MGRLTIPETCRPAYRIRRLRPLGAEPRWQRALAQPRAAITAHLDRNGHLPGSGAVECDDAAARWSAADRDGMELRAEHALGIGGDPSSFGVCVTHAGRCGLLRGGVSLLFPTVCFDDAGARTSHSSAPRTWRTYDG